MQGRISKTLSGGAWLLLEPGPDARFLRSEALLLGQGDLVLASVESMRQGKDRARLLQVLERGRKSFPALLHQSERRPWLEPLVEGLPEICDCDPEQVRELESGALVVASWLPPEMGKSHRDNRDRDNRHRDRDSRDRDNRDRDSHDSRDRDNRDRRDTGKDGAAAGRAHVQRVLGLATDPGVATELALASYELRQSWPKAVDEECKRLKARERKVLADDKRIDLRDRAFVTIDGESAKDFDDAVHCRPLPDGGWQLMVAIADVSAYVQPGSALDKEAQLRGVSAYFSDKVIPMLPPVLSEDLCSLVPDSDRPAVVCDMRITAAGQIAEYSFARALIRSAARLVYEHIDKALVDAEQLEAQTLHSELRAFRDVAMALGETRRKRQALDLDLPVLSVHLDDDNNPTAIRRRRRLGAEVLIEDAMLAANQCAARELSDRTPTGPMRICAKPDGQKWTDLLSRLKQMRLESPGDRPDLASYNRLLEQIEGHSNEILLKRELIRTLTLAQYAPDTQTGHFPLALDAYTHFTSPIRRYADLLVHRLLLAGKDATRLSKKSIGELCEQCSSSDRTAERASRQAQRHLQCQLAADQQDQWHAGQLITHIEGKGLLVQLTDFGLDALMPWQRLRGRFQTTAGGFALRPRGRGPQLLPGASLQVQILQVQPEKQRITLGNLRLAE